MNELSLILRANLDGIRRRIAAAAERAGRRPEEIRLVGVTKYVDARTARALVEAGLSDLAESRPQELWKKTEALSDLPIRWHFVGHLQRNKLKRTLPLCSLFHSGDSLRLLEALQLESDGRPVDLLLEVNISGDANKHGFRPDELPNVLASLTEWTNLRVRGLMGMAALEGGIERARRDFAALRSLRDELRSRSGSGGDLPELSMGMSDDFEAAIEEGATLIRVGSALFEGLPPPETAP